MQDRPTERVRVLLDGLTASAIVDRVHPYYSGYQFEGEWLDTLKESIEGELDDLDRIVREAGDPTDARRFAERLEAAASERADVTLFGVDYMALPLDADGVPIHVGDVLDNTHKDGFRAKRVTGITYHENGRTTIEVDEDRLRWHNADKLCHHHAPTVEDVLREFASDIADVLGGDDFKLDDSDELFAEYAAKLRLAGEDA